MQDRSLAAGERVWSLGEPSDEVSPPPVKAAPVKHPLWPPMSRMNNTDAYRSGWVVALRVCLLVTGHSRFSAHCLMFWKQGQAVDILGLP